MPVREKRLCCNQHKVPWYGMDSKGTVYLEMLKTWRLLTSALKVMSCSLSSCSPAACCSTVVPLSDLYVRKPDVQFNFATWETESTRPHRYRSTEQLCPAENTFFPNCRKKLKTFVMVWQWRHRMVLLWIAACPATATSSMDDSHWSYRRTHPTTHSFC